MKNHTTAIFLHQNVIINNKLYAYNKEAKAYQEANVQSQPQKQVVYVQHQFQQAYVQPQPQKQVVYVYPPQQQQVAYNYHPEVIYKNVQPQPQQAYVQPQPQQVFYRNTKPLQYVVQPQQVRYPNTQDVIKVVNDGKPLSESIHITTEKAEKIMRDLDKKFPKQPIQNNNDRPLPNNVYSGKNYCDDLSGGTGSTNIDSNSSSDKNNSNYSLLVKMVQSELFIKLNGEYIEITPSNKFNISPNQALQPVNCKFCTKNK